MTTESLHRRKVDGDRGAAAVEFALVVPLLLLLTFGIVEFGRAYNAQITLQHAVREGARYYAIHHNDADGDPVDDTKQVTVDAATTLDIDKAKVTVSPEPCDPPESVHVTAEYDFVYLAWDFGPNPTLSAEGVMRCGG